ncbi:MAG TPA: hypothetical protein VMH82_11500 [Myxococcota bacterium]|jgi:hypothetical protein|nr:hypothetical protein [Myxococcota bacterium]
MAQKIARTGITRERGWLYFLDKKGDVSRAKMARGGGKASKIKPQVVAKVGVKREDGFLYFIDRDGDVSKTKMARRTATRRARGRAPSRRARKPARRAIARRARR